ncbi:hypothetical protein [Candidatus Enterococcus murrayae]|nr:hypothetical protein [Enterococcus sp. MJM16]
MSVEVYYDQKPAYYEFANKTKKLPKTEILKMVQEKYFVESD